MEKAFDVLYFNNTRDEGKQLHSRYREPWKKSDLYCPRCGKQEVWFCNDGGDYYVGEQHICINCKSGFYLPGGVADATGEQNEQRLTHLTANAGVNPQ